MSHSYGHIAIHLIFSTKDRHPFITEHFRQELNAYLVGILRNLGSPSIKTNTTTDHAHSLFLLSKKEPLDFVIEQLKRSSSKWIKTKDTSFANFYWQVGYAAFSVGQTEIDRVASYIEHQQNHHQKESFEDEIRRLFQEYGLSLNEENFFH